MAVMYLCTRCLRFTVDWLNLAFIGLIYLVPIFASVIVLRRLRGKPRLVAAVLVAPFAAIALLGLPFLLIVDLPAALGHRQFSRELSMLQQGQSTVHLDWVETPGGALGPHGVNLEQRRSLLPGLYAVKSLDYFEGASEGSIEASGTDKIALHIPRSLSRQEVNRVYLLKPWLYF
jgi:hypothetical protein